MIQVLQATYTDTLMHQGVYPYEQHEIENAFDNDPLTFTASDAKDGVRYLQVKFEATDIVEVRVTARSNLGGQLGPHHIKYSTDGENFNGNCPIPESAEVVSTGGQVHIHPCVVLGCQGVRVVADFEGEHLGLAEFHAYKAPPPEPTYTSYEMHPGMYFGHDVLDHAFDNDPSTFIASSTFDGDRYFQVKFDATDIVEVRVRARHDSGGQLGKHHIEYSTDGENFNGNCPIPESAEVVSTDGQVHIHPCDVPGCQGVRVVADFVSSYLGIAEFHAYKSL